MRELVSFLIWSLIKLRLNCPGPLLASLFDVSTASVSRLFLKWLAQMGHQAPILNNLARPMKVCRKQCLNVFENLLGKKLQSSSIVLRYLLNVPVICKPEHPPGLITNIKIQQKLFILIRILPQGVVGFVSESWGGWVSDKYLTEHYGILRKLLPEDVVLADCSFDIAESVGSVQAKLHIPAFTKGKTQLSAVEVEGTRKIANVRIHVERVIGAVRQRYPILRSTLPIHYMMKRNGKDIPLIDRMVCVWCALNNVGCFLWLTVLYYVCNCLVIL